MTRSRILALALLTFAISAMAGLGFWNFSQSKKHAFQIHERWADRTSQRIDAERHTVMGWLEDLQGLRKEDIRRELLAQPDFVVAYWFDVKSHEFEKWVARDYKKFFEGTPDSRLVLTQLKATDTQRTQFGPMMFLQSTIAISAGTPIDKRHALVTIQLAPGITKILEDESSWAHVQSFAYDLGGRPLYVGADEAAIKPELLTVMQRAEGGERSGRLPLKRAQAWQWLASFHKSTELGLVFIVLQATPWVYHPLFIFVICLVATIWLGALPWKAAEQLRRGREAAALSDFAKRVDKFVRGKEPALSEPPYPFKELTPIVHSLRWLIPQWKQAESAPQEYGLERHLLGLLIESLPEGILFFNAQGSLQLGNELGKVFLALQQESGREFKLVSGVQVPRGFLEPYAEPVFTDQQKNLGKEVEVGWADGKHLYRIWVESVEVDDQTLGYIVVIRDITFRKQWEYVQEQVLSGITHDLRGPLSAIMGYLDLLKRQMKEAPPKQLEYLSMAREAGNRLTQMISDILDVVRFEQGKIDMEVQAISVDSMFERLKNIFSVTAQQKGVILEMSMDGQGVIATGDPKLLERVLDNLVGNAIKFTPPGGTISVKASRNGHRTLFAVTDTGRGIPREAQSRIFDKFQQVRPGDRSGGYGLGLAVVKFIVNAHKGEIRVESEVDKGSTFSFWIPDQAVTAKADASHESSEGESVHS